MQKNTKDLKSKEETINKKNATKADTKPIKTEKSKSSSSKSSTATSKRTSAKNKTTTPSTLKSTVSRNKQEPKVSTKNTDTTKKTTSSNKSTNLKTTKSKNTKSVAKVADKASSSKNSSNSIKAGKSASKKISSKTTSKASSKGKTKKVDIIEYYDLPYRYNQTVVKILAQTPTTLFVYWDISDDDRKKYVDEYGKNFFENTYPILIVHNKTLNYSFEIEINDFANSWYFNIKDAKCNYEIELGRRAKPYKIELPNNYIYVTSSNVIETPNNHILFDKGQRTVFFRNVKTNTTVAKNFSKFDFIKYAGQIYNIYDVYKKLYINEEFDNLMSNPSSTF